MTTTTYPVTGMSCEHCVTAVTSELGSLGGVSGATVHLEPDGIFRMTVASDGALPVHAVSGALGAAGGYLISRADGRIPCSDRRPSPAQNRAALTCQPLRGGPATAVSNGQSGEEGTFTIRSLWLVSALTEIGEASRVDRRAPRARRRAAVQHPQQHPHVRRRRRTTDRQIRGHRSQCLPVFDGEEGHPGHPAAHRRDEPVKARSCIRCNIPCLASGRRHKGYRSRAA